MEKHTPTPWIKVHSKDAPFYAVALTGSGGKLEEEYLAKFHTEEAQDLAIKAVNAHDRLQRERDALLRLVKEAVQRFDKEIAGGWIIEAKSAIAECEKGE